MSLTTIILIRGLPGAGKSTFAKLLSENGKYPVYSVDDYFTDNITDTYKFIHTENHIAYKECLEKTRLAIISQTEKIFVANTFTMDWELKPYFELAKEFNSTIHVCTLEKYHTSKNVHEISDEQIQKMSVKYKIKLL